MHANRARTDDNGHIRTLQQMFDDLDHPDHASDSLREDRIALAIRVFEALGIEPVQHTRSSWLSH